MILERINCRMNFFEEKRQRRAMALMIDANKNVLRTMKELAWPKEIGEKREIEVTCMWFWDDVNDTKDPVLYTGTVFLHTFANYGMAKTKDKVIGMY